MNEQLVFALHDKKAKNFEAPFVIPNKAYAIRSFQELVNKDNIYNRFCQDFELCQIGTYDQTTGELKAIKPLQIASASELVERKEQKK